MDNDTDMKYIQKRNHKHVVSYNIRKWDGERMVFYGAFSSLQEAQEYRDFLIKNNWDTSLKKLVERPLKYVYHIQGKYDVIPIVDNKQIYVGRFNTLEDAIYERDRFLEAECDFDTYFTATDDTADGERFLQGRISTKVIFETGPRNDAYVYKHSIKRRHY